MPASDKEQQGQTHLYSVFFAPRGLVRLVNLGREIAQQYLSPFDKLIGIVGSPASGKSMLIRGMFPGLELTNDDNGVNVRPLPLLDADEDDSGFYSPHTYHVDIHFEAAFVPMHELATAVQTALDLGKRVVAEHFDLLYPFMDRNANLLIGIGEEVIVTRPNLFGPEAQDIADIVHKSLKYRLMCHTAEHLCIHYLQQQGENEFGHADVRHGFILTFPQKPNIDLADLKQYISDKVSANLQVSFVDEQHIRIGEQIYSCTGPRVHVARTGEIEHFCAGSEFVFDPISKQYFLVGVIGEHIHNQMWDLNKIEAM